MVLTGVRNSAGMLTGSDWCWVHNFQVMHLMPFSLASMLCHLYNFNSISAEFAQVDVVLVSTWLQAGAQLVPFCCRDVGVVMSGDGRSVLNAHPDWLAIRHVFRADIGSYDPCRMWFPLYDHKRADRQMFPLNDINACRLRQLVLIAR